MKVLVDMNLSPKWVERLNDSGFDAIHWSSIGRSNAPDTEIMAYAASAGYVVLTHDLDFGNIVAARRGKGTPSVVQIRAGDLSPDAIASAVVSALRQMEDQLLAGALITVDAKRTRLRLLNKTQRAD